MARGYRSYTYLGKEEKDWLKKTAKKNGGESSVLRALIVDKMLKEAPGTWDARKVLLKKELDKS